MKTPSLSAIAAATEISSLVQEWTCDTITCAEIIDRHFASRDLVESDDDGFDVRHGDRIYFSYGIPPVSVNAEIATMDGELWAMTPGHNPDRCKLRELRGLVGSFYKA